MPSLHDQRKIIIDQARGLAERAKSDGRDLTADELATVTRKIEEAKALGARIKAAEDGDRILAQLGEMDPGAPHDAGSGPRYLDLSDAGRRQLAASIARSMIGDVDGRKAILPVGETVASIPTLPTDPISLGKVAPNLLSVLPTVQVPAGSQARYLRQGTRTNLAAAVAPGAVKPTSIYGLVAVDISLKVYAHLSEPIDRFLIEDSDVLATWLASELAYGVVRAVETDVVNGATGGAGITGLLQTSGIRVIPFATDILATTRAAVTDAETAGYASDLVFVLSPADWAAAETLKASTSGTYLVPSAPVDRANQRLWGVPVITVLGLPAKTGVLLDRTAVAIYVDRLGLRTDWGSPADQWTKNLVTARTEGRFDLAIFQAGAIGKIGTAA